MLKIYKYDIREEKVVAPIIEVLDVQFQEGVPMMWALVNTEGINKTCQFKIFGTGHEIDPEILKEFSYFKTLQDPWEQLVFHVFVKIAL